MICACGCPFSDPAGASLHSMGLHIRKSTTIFSARMTLAMTAAKKVGESTDIHPVVYFIAKEFNVDAWLLLTRDRKPRTAFARFVIGWLLRETTNMSFPKIGRILRRDHASVLHGCRVINARMKREPLFARRIEGYKAKLNAIPANVRSVSLVSSEQHEAENEP